MLHSFIIVIGFLYYFSVLCEFKEEISTKQACFSYHSFLPCVVHCLTHQTEVGS